VRLRGRWQIAAISRGSVKRSIPSGGKQRASQNRADTKAAKFGPDLQLQRRTLSLMDIKLSDDNVARLEAALRPEAVSGPRYNEKVMAWVDR
jgi:hypothetical protein